MYVKPVANVSKAVSKAVLSALLIGTLLSSCAGSSALDGGPEGDVNNESDSLVSESGQGSSERNVVTELELQHRSGQTFLTWSEPRSSSRYHVYRSSQPISTANISLATLLTERWGPLGNDTSVNKNAVPDIPAHFVISDLGAPLSDKSGLFVHTTEDDGTAYYAVTTIANGVENKTLIAGQNTGSTQESVATPKPVLTLSVNDGKGRLYTQYMNYQQWNPTLNGYAFNYFVALPSSYNPTKSYPLQLELHAYGYFPRLREEVRFGWQVIQLIPVDPGDDQNTSHTWWYGHARDHDYQRDGETPGVGAIENFTEQRVMKSIQDLIDSPEFNVDENLIHAFGDSMGASGSVTLGLHYPSVLSGIYASQPMMNYADSARFRYNFEKLFGSVERNLPIVNRGLYTDAIQQFSEGGSQPTGVWDWMNHHSQVRRRRGDDFAYMMIDFGKADDVIDWQTQGKPTFAAFAAARVAHTATAREGVGHQWSGFAAVNEHLFRFETGPWFYPNNLSFPAFSNVSDNGRIDPPLNGDDLYQTTLEWSTPQYSFGQSIVDQVNRYEITLRSLASSQVADVTPRNTQAFKPTANAQCEWTARTVNDGQIIDSGVVIVDESELLSVSQLPIASGTGTRLAVECAE